MIVSCPYCSTRYEIDAARLASPNPMLKCSRCRHIFPAPSSKKSTPSPAPAKANRPDDENLTLPFEEPGWKDEPDAPPADSFDESEPSDGFVLGTEERSDEPVAKEADDEEPAAARSRGAARPVEDTEGEPEDAPPVRRGPRRRREPQRSERSPVRPLFLFLAAVVAAYGMLTRALFASPALCDKLVNRLPMIAALGDDRLFTRKVALSDVVGNYQRLKDGKDVFVITGKAVNTAAVALHGIQVSAKLYNGAGRMLDQKTIYCGNVISAKVLKDLTPAEVSILQKLSPPKKFDIEPGESSTFVVVFMDPPREAAEFTTQVAAAQRQA
jgi:predicted Zn finger-like uncharacterized protein